MQPSAIVNQRKRAGSPKETRPNPGQPANMGPRSPGAQDRAAHRSPGAAPALTHHGRPTAAPASRGWLPRAICGLVAVVSGDNRAKCRR
jgi:hypothetical protein